MSWPLRPLAVAVLPSLEVLPLRQLIPQPGACLPGRTIVSRWLVRAVAAHGLTVRSGASAVTGCLNRQ